MANLKSMSRADFPREKLEKYGPKKLKDHELLAILLGSGIKGKNVLSLANSILKKTNTVGIDKLTLQQIRQIKGVGSAKAAQILAMIELGKRLTSTKPDILTPTDIYNLCADFKDSKKEHLVAFYLDTQSRLIERQIISIGTLNANLIHPREIFEPAISLHSASIIIAHNHPTGNLEPSREDREITNRLMMAGRLLGVPLDDHLVVTTSGIASFKKLGLI